MKTFWNNLGEYLHDLEVGNDFLNKTQKNTSLKGKD